MILMIIVMSLIFFVIFYFFRYIIFIKKMFMPYALQYLNTMNYYNMLLKKRTHLQYIPNYNKLK